ncbi:hypothetical protein GGX14DRAFT_403415 [Mycena pura]|uniref:Uncharacterized protein n=1 Tax=Mycena pura TaxID=153505 RepID=A0AAD6Y6A6_9AGAR|nr:hypothetical protein GGX14DRAFT_403415 [Mycena pura]
MAVELCKLLFCHNDVASGAMEGASSIDMIRRSDIHGSSSILDQENYLSHGSDGTRKTGARRNISIFKNMAEITTLSIVFPARLGDVSGVNHRDPIGAGALPAPNRWRHKVPGLEVSEFEGAVDLHKPFVQSDSVRHTLPPESSDGSDAADRPACLCLHRQAGFEPTIVPANSNSARWRKPFRCQWMGKSFLTCIVAPARPGPGPESNGVPPHALQSHGSTVPPPLSQVQGSGVGASFITHGAPPDTLYMAGADSGAAGNYERSQLGRMFNFLGAMQIRPEGRALRCCVPHARLSRSCTPFVHNELGQKGMSRLKKESPTQGTIYETRPQSSRYRCMPCQLYFGIHEQQPRVVVGQVDSHGIGTVPDEDIESGGRLSSVETSKSRPVLVQTVNRINFIRKKASVP